MEQLPRTTEDPLVRPWVSESEIITKISSLYSLDVVEIVQLNAYDDFNCRVKCKTSNGNVISYVCKILNNIDSRRSDCIDAQHRLMKYLAKRGCIVSEPIVNNNNQYFSMETFGETENVFRLLTYVSGSTLEDSQSSRELFHNVGLYVGELYCKIKDYKDDVLASHKTPWMLESMPKIAEYIYAVPNVDHLGIVKGIIKAFEEKAIPSFPELERGIIHGDLNTNNIIVNGNNIVGLIDFGDVCFAPYIFELSTCLAYMLMYSKDLEIGKEILKGYQNFRQLTPKEIELLKICVCARICQSLVLGCYNALSAPDNAYILSSQKDGWTVLQKLSQINDSDLWQLWNIK